MQRSSSRIQIWNDKSFENHLRVCKILGLNLDSRSSDCLMFESLSHLIDYDAEQYFSSRFSLIF